ncbi:MAG: hypothetical protein ABH858_04195 [Candidatus Omnitrophota bacterium]
MGVYKELTTTSNTYLATDANAKVGIGTTSPKHNLEIGSSAPFVFRNDDTSDSIGFNAYYSYGWKFVTGSK